MQNILRFFIRYRMVLSLLLLQSLGLSLTYARSLAHENLFWSNVLERQAQWRGWLHSWEAYLNLRHENDVLIAELAKVRSAQEPDTTRPQPQAYEEFGFDMIPGRLMFISHNSASPWGLIDIGSDAGLTPPFAVLGTKGIIGIAYETSEHYTRVTPLSHPSMRISASAERTGHFGTLQWHSANSRYAELVDVAFEAQLKKGDRIVTDARSELFPAGWLIGTIERVEVDSTQFTQTALVRLAADLNRQQGVMAAFNIRKAERDSIAP
ncbi:MAG: rod shape-determining protein MreC [Bacteroidota bacterium]|jgi:rod shape-determining protein MreC